MTENPFDTESRYTSGYEGPTAPSDEDKITEPEDGEWIVEFEKVMLSGTEESVYARIVFNGTVLGMLRLPSIAHVTWLRERIQDG